MRQSKLLALGKKIIHDICALDMTVEEAAVTFDLVFNSLMEYVTRESIVEALADGLVEEAEEALKEALENVDQ